MPRKRYSTEQIRWGSGCRLCASRSAHELSQARQDTDWTQGRRGDH